MDDIVERLKPDTDQLDPLESQELLAAVMVQRRGPARRGRLLLVAGGAAVALCLGVTVAINGTDDGRAGDHADGAERSLRAGGEGECEPRLRIDKIIYAGVGYLEDSNVGVTAIGRGEVSTCGDEGASLQGPRFPATPETVPVFAFTGYPTDTVVGVEFPSGYEVYITERISRPEQQKILNRLTSAK